MRLRHAAVVWGLSLFVSVPTAALAQGAPRAMGTWFYGVSTGLGQRTIAGTFSPADEPEGAGQPPSPRTLVPINLEGGVGLGRRLALFAAYDGGAVLGGPQEWGTVAYHASLRGWVTNRVWVEGGVGPAEMAFRPSGSAGATAYWWSPGFETAGGYEIFQGPTVTLHVFVRYTTAHVDAVRVQSVTVQVGLLGRH